jgi:ABC-2 type transport system ATP-binding protein
MTNAHPAECCLSIERLSKRFGARRILEGIDLQLRAGQFCALLGSNGAGKTTLFQLLTGLYVPDQGRVRIAGHDLTTEAAAALAQIGVVFQEQALDLDLSARRNLAFHADLHGLSRALARQRIAQGSQSLGLGADLDRPVRVLSGGTRRKVELVRALLHRPALLLMDEATVGLDPKSRKDLLSAVWQDVRGRGTGVLWATHWVQEAEQADAVVLLHQGQLIARGTPDEVRQALGADTLEEGFIARTHAAGQGLTQTRTKAP